MDMDEYPEGVDRHQVDFLGASTDGVVSLGSVWPPVALADQKIVKVSVLGKYRVVHDGEPYTAGDIVEVPESIANEWVRARLVERVTDDGKAS